MNFYRKLSFVLLAFFFLSAAFGAELKLAWIFRDHGVLQRNMPIPVWGSTDPGIPVHVELNGKTVHTTSSKTGEFLVRLAPEEAGGPYTLTVTSGWQKVQVQDVMIGEVWLAGGQSNMQYQLDSTYSPKWASLTPEEQEASLNRVQLREYLDTLTDANALRYLAVPRLTSWNKETEANATWTVMDAQNAGALTAVGAWFGRFLQERTGVTVGIISCSWGATFAEAWTSRAGLLSNPITVPMITAKDKVYADPAVDPKEINERQKAILIQENKLDDPGNKGIEMGWANPDFDDSAWKNMSIPGHWMSQNITKGNGIIWVRKHVQLPKAWLGKELVLHLGPIDKHDITYFNGVEVGRTGKGYEEEHWNVPRTYTIPGNLVTSTDALIAIRAYSFFYNGQIHGTPDLYSIAPKDASKSIPLAGTWKATAEVDFGKLYTFSVYYPYGTNNPNTPSILFDAMINEIIPYGIRGVIWYQGENNAEGIQWGQEYRSVLGTMIKDWRYHWEQGDFPFLQVQLAAYHHPAQPHGHDAWPYLRESQVLVCQDLPNVFLASAIDIGDANDIHPYNKKDVGLRLFKSAMNHVYGDTTVTPFGPLYQGYTLEGNKIRIAFKYAQGLYFKDGTPKGFTIADENGNFVPADKVLIDGESILVSAKAVRKPAAVRYAWENCPDGNLYNSDDLPASSFRTDSW